MPMQSRFDDYEESSSEDEILETGKRKVKKTIRRANEDSSDDSEEEVLGILSEDESDIAASDVEEVEDDLPDSKAWGKTKRNFYSTDYVDQDYGGFQGKDATFAEFEEEEAKTLQTQLAKSMDDADFDLEFSIPQKETDNVHLEEVVKTDVSKLSKRQKMELLKKEAPEYLLLTDDFDTKVAIIEKYLNPIIEFYEGKLTSCEATTFVLAFRDKIINYCIHINIYRLLKITKKANVRAHPVMERLYQYRKELSEMESIFNEILKPQWEKLSQESILKSESDVENNEKPSLEVLKKIIQKPKTVKFVVKKSKKVVKEDLAMDIEKEIENEKDEIKSGIEESSEMEKRGVTYQISKNKGLMPHRKKELRNPRVKHRNKFRKAQIRRKGAVREVRTALRGKYGGEMSGINSTVIKSVKFKW